ncbi:Crp/Fnr family transcriptional regulator [Sphingomonas sp. SUN019]|uniref:Crp/Fnr family transcriptional regulator n=1 Tax=Sphingomonas sp. SUN019 TaxID=2937788 RepID=UPI002164B3EF|nr:Crp/Fnr family transcriptional regulator [Sphingomonas sp. SUN019]UVO50546.1 Crp/Fnr family transcriptional regulator [Sphingomonas sp. SUN019]
MASSCFADHLGDFVALTPTERDAIHRLEERERILRRTGILVRENDRAGELFILKRGMMMSYVLLDDGSRQILRFLFPGDMMGVASIAYALSPETIVALTDCTVCPFECGALAQLMTEHPRLGAAIMVLHQMERVSLTDRLVGLGRTSAKVRVASLLLELRNRMRRFDPEIGSSFVLGLTQEEIGDATGLTAVHVNRMLRQLEDDGLIGRENGRVLFRDEVRLARAANYVDRFEGLDLSWLPAAR